MSVTKYIIFAALIASAFAGLVKVPLTNQDNLDYTASVQIGSNNQQFDVIMDTGSSNVWVVGEQCKKSPTCAGHNYFNPQESSSFVNVGEDIEFGYGSGDVLCSLGQDTVTFGGYTVKNFEFGVCNDVEFEGFADSGYDGIIGLAFQTISQDNLPPLFKDLVNGGDVNPGQFSMYLSSQTTGSVMVLGGYDEELAEGEMVYIKLESDTYWQIPVNDVILGTRTLTNPIPYGIIDSGTSLLVVPEQAYNEMIEELKLDQEEFPCDLANNWPALSYVLGDEEFTLPGPLIVLQLSESQCMLAVDSMDLSPEGIGFILGDVFMRSYYVLFDYANTRVGISVAKQQA